MMYLNLYDDVSVSEKDEAFADFEDKTLARKYSLFFMTVLVLQHYFLIIWKELEQVKQSLTLTD